jgi:dihydropteroate synthase
MDTSEPGSPFAELPQRATRWQLRTRTLELPPQPLLMGIINVTPDSFSDGGQFFDSRVAIQAGLALAAAGASLLDVGGESTRPYAEPVDEAEELRRVLPVVQALAEQTNVPISIDTSKALVAREALAAGAEIINDITALAGDAEMLPLAVASRAGLCLMHMQGTPQTMQDAPLYADVVADVFAWLAARRDACLAAGFEPQRLALDPGIGFGKTHGHNLKLLAGAWRFHALGCPLVVGHSRKGYIGKVLGDKQADRTAGTIGASIALALQGVQILRVHDVLAVRQALDLFTACGGLTGQPIDLP